jgi:hypothetical protein
MEFEGVRLNAPDILLGVAAVDLVVLSDLDAIEPPAIDYTGYGNGTPSEPRSLAD